VRAVTTWAISQSTGRGDQQQLADLATRLSGSSDLYHHDGRRPSASINFVTVHDGFTIRDLVSYNEKHNEVNKENNNDGTNDNNSWNCGVEGPTDDVQIRALRLRQMRNFMVTLILSQGVPLIQAGDELARTQSGNNNAYCQDNEISWLNWDLDDEVAEFHGFVKQVIDLRASEPVFRRRTFFQGRPIHGDIKDLYWLDPAGHEMSDEDWAQGWAESLGMVLVGEEINETDPRGNEITGDSFLILLNAAGNDVNFMLPVRIRGRTMQVELDTADSGRVGSTVGSQYHLVAHSAAVIRLPTKAT
jgi:isoamylase